MLMPASLVQVGTLGNHPNCAVYLETVAKISDQFAANTMLIPRRTVTMPILRRRRRRTWRLCLLSASATRGFLAVGTRLFPCAIGRAGLRARKNEGDGATPRGTWPVVEVLYRADRGGRRPATPVRSKTIRRDDGWCDAPGDRNYNRAVRHPYGASAERLWRDDGLYDLVLVLGYNDRPRVSGRGSAIFMHLARDDLAPTAGCIALAERDLRLLLATMLPSTVVVARK